MHNDHDCPYLIRGSVEGFGKCKLVPDAPTHAVFEHCIDNRYGCLVREENLKQRLEDSERTTVMLKNALQLLYGEQNDAPLENHRSEWERAMKVAEAALKAVEQ